MNISAGDLIRVIKFREHEAVSQNYRNQLDQILEVSYIMEEFIWCGNHYFYLDEIELVYTS